MKSVRKSLLDHLLAGEAVQTETDIHCHRVKAAECSGGISSNRIYDMIDRAILSANLKGRVLDYGAGVGQLTRRLLAMNRFDVVTGADMMAAPAGLESEVKWIEQDLNAPLPSDDGVFDVVIAAEVIEHLENPRFTIREIFRLLRPGGIAMITTPNNESWRSLASLVVRGTYAAFGEANYPAHITPFLRKDFTRAFLEAGFPAPCFHFTDEGGIPGKPAITWQQVSFRLLRGLRFSDNLMAISNKPIW